MNRVSLKYFRYLLVACISLMMPVSEAIEFSADAYQQSPKSTPQKSRMYVGVNRVRKEYVKSGVDIIEIHDLERKRTFVLHPVSKTYSVNKLMASAFTNRPLAGKKFNPCANLKNTRCTKMAVEKVNGASVDRWRFESKNNNQLLVSEYWIDRKRFMVLKEQLHDATQVNMRLLGYELLQNRKVERWERVTFFPTGEQFSTLQWYDDQLGMVVREEMPGGYLRELSNIRTGAQSRALFDVPSDYKVIEKKASVKQE